VAIKLDKNFDTSKAIKNLARGFKLTPHIDRFLPTWDEEGFTYTSQRKLPDDAWHPSSDCLPSLNTLYHKALEHDPKARPKHAPSTVKNFQVGHFWHQWLQWIVVEKLGFATWDDVERSGMKHWGLEPLPEGTKYEDFRTAVRVDEEGNKWRKPKPWHWVTGSGDIAPCRIPEHGEYVVDFKTMNARSYRMAGSGTPEERLLNSWECQINVYMDFFDQERALVVGICKDTPHEMLEFEFKRNQPLIDALYDKWKLASGCVVDKHEPPDDLYYPLPLRGLT
jgi:hypothetical protein